MNQPASGKGVAPWVWPLLIVLTIVLAAGFVYVLNDRDDGNPPQDQPGGSTHATLKHGEDYYVFIKLVELTPTQAEDEAWDGDGSGPDVQATLTWRGNIIYTTATQSDTLIAAWNMIGVDAWDVAQDMGEVDLESLIRAALVNVQADETVTLTLTDKDLTRDDPAGTYELTLDELRLGENVLLPEPAAERRAVRIVVHVLEHGLPLADLAERLNAQ